MKIILKILEQDIKNKIDRKEKNLLDAAILDEEQQTILRTEFERNLVLELKTASWRGQRCYTIFVQQKIVWFI